MPSMHRDIKATIPCYESNERMKASYESEIMYIEIDVYKYSQIRIKFINEILFISKSNPNIL